MATSERSRTKRVLVAVAVVVGVLVAAAAWYVNDYYHADDVALAVIADEDGDADGVVVQHLPSGDIAFMPDKPIAGLVFYPGAKVQPEAYAPLMQRCAEKGILCVIVKPLFNLAIIDMNAADGAIDQFPEIDCWMLAGHSMGGVAASDFASRHADAFDGIVFLASYPSADLASFNGDALCIVGSNDEVLNREKAEEAKSKLPVRETELTIVGGNHAYFGNYGEQAGDGPATISREDQQAQTAAAIVELAKAH